VAAQFPSQQDETPSPGGFPQDPGGVPDDGGGQGGFYQGQVYEFSLTWGPEWTLVDDVAEEGVVELITVTNGVSYVTVGGTTSQDPLPNVVMRFAEMVGNGQWTFRVATADQPTYAAAFFDTSQEDVGVSIFAAVTGPSTRQLIIWEHPMAQNKLEPDDTEEAAYNELIKEGLEF
jgi:hypothetical protein